MKIKKDIRYKDICKGKEFFSKKFKPYKELTIRSKIILGIFSSIIVIYVTIDSFKISRNDFDIFLKYKVIKKEEANFVFSLPLLFPLLVSKEIDVPLDWNSKYIDKYIRIMLYTMGKENEPKRIYVLIPGGPGQSGLAMQNVGKSLFRNDPDSLIILFEHRGTGKSNYLKCNALENKIEFTEQDHTDCISELNKTFGKGLEYFNSFQAAKDIEFMLSKFPQTPTTIYSVSYGTIVSQRLLKINVPQIDSYILVSSTIPNAHNLWKYDKEPYSNFFNYCKSQFNCLKNLENHTFTEFHEFMSDLKTKCNFKKPSLTDDIYEVLRNSMQFIRENSNTFFTLYKNLSICNENEIIKIVNDFRTQKKLKEIDYSYAMHSIIAENELNGSNINSNYPKSKIENTYLYKLPKDKKILLISGDIDPITTPSMSRQLYSLLPKNQRFMLNVKNQAHSPLDASCKVEIILNFSGKNFDINKLIHCKDESIELISDNISVLKEKI